jgi:hypothetical protein
VTYLTLRAAAAARVAHSTALTVSDVRRLVGKSKRRGRMVPLGRKELG